MTIKVDSRGRVLIPAEFRRVLKLLPGTRLVARVEGGQLVLEQRDAALRRVQRLLDAVRADVNLADELIADRRSEVGQHRA